MTKTPLRFSVADGTTRSCGGEKPPPGVAAPGPICPDFDVCGHRLPPFVLPIQRRVSEKGSKGVEITISP
ncbi:hypothetical protein, partial [Salipiger sp. HF18]|uniref:hypothetical protein n=1 Tax=Salipiger sp. HF18 TaxID=2721557 RepID=UPI001C37C747